MSEEKIITHSQAEKMIALLESIKRLLILQLSKSEGTTSDMIGNAIGLDGSTIRHILGAKNNNDKNKAKQKSS